MDDDEAPLLGPAAGSELVEGALERRKAPSEPDDLDRLRARIERLREVGRGTG